MNHSLSAIQFDAAITALDLESATPEEKTEMLMEIAMGMQTQPKTSEQLRQAIALYEQAIDICPAEAPLLKARVLARMGTALQALPESGIDALCSAKNCYEEALPVFKAKGRPEECAEAQMNLGLVLQSLSGARAARIHDSIQCYHDALRVFNRDAYPQEYAILHNNLAIAYLSIPTSDEKGKMREALAVQSFEEVLSVINLVDHPTEYAMIQNNLGNALQYAASGHALQNNLRALTAYDEALKVRNARDTPLEYANTIANKANVLRNLPEKLEAPWQHLRDNLNTARALYEEARSIFASFGQTEGVGTVDEALLEIKHALSTAPLPPDKVS